MKKQIGRSLAALGLKKKALGVYFFFTNTWTDMVLSSRKKSLPLLVKRRSKNGIYAIDLDSDWLGLGARIVKTLEILLYCEEHGLTPAIRYGYLEKTKERPDYFGELFQYKLTDPAALARARYTHILDVDELGWPENYNLKLSLGTARGLFDKYLALNRDIVAEVDQFRKDHFGSAKVLGVHYRGTDKAGEAPLVRKEDLLDQVRTLMRERPTLQLIFVSTDDVKIIHFLKESGLPVIYRQDAVRSDDGDQFHRKKEISKTIVNRDAIVNMMLLSGCDFLLKTASILSDCSVVFNPSMEVKVISFPHSTNLTWWPATEIKENQENGRR